MVFFEQTATRRGYAFADSSTTTTSLIVDLSNLLPLTSDPLTAGVWSVSVDSCYNCGCSVWKGKSNSLIYSRIFHPDANTDIYANSHSYLNANTGSYASDRLPKLVEG
jgi:hypothetical protein